MTERVSPSADLVRLIRSQADVVREICTFNQNPADYLHESRRAEFFPQHADSAIWTCERSRRHLSRYILSRISAATCVDPRRPEWPLALLHRPGIDRLSRHVAAALVGARVRRCVSRVEVLKWREWLSPEAHEFALTRAGLLPLSPSADIDAGQVSAQELGHAWIVGATRRWNDAIVRRFMLKLPSETTRDLDAIDGAFASRLVHSVLSIVESRWCSSFATMRA